MSDEFDSAGRWVVGTDGSLRSDKAVMWAAKHATERKEPVPLLVMHAIPESPLPSAAAQDVIDDQVGRKDASRVRAEQILGDVVKRVREVYPDLLVETAVVRGHPAQVLAEAGADADQIVVGARGRGSSALVKMLGGTSEHVVANAQGTVAVVPEPSEDDVGGPVVLGLDDSEEGRLAIARAFQAASLRGVPLVAVLAWADSAYPSHASGGGAEVSQQVIEEGKRLIADKVAEFPDVPVTIEAPHGRPEAALIEASRVAGLVVIGSKGRGGFTGLRLGSTTRHVLRESHCPVVVTRAVAGWTDRTGRGVGIVAH